jgi:hypothetical protein
VYDNGNIICDTESDGCRGIKNDVVERSFHDTWKAKVGLINTDRQSKCAERTHLGIDFSGFLLIWAK